MIDLGSDPRGGVEARLFIDPDQARALGASPQQLRVSAAAGRSARQTFDTVRHVIAASPATVAHSVRTADDVARIVAKSYTGGTAEITAALLVFVVIALLVAALVSANTFAVILAQRAQELALLRCVGADVRQIRRMVLGGALAL